MSSNTITSRSVSIDRAASLGIVSRTAWGEESPGLAPPIAGGSSPFSTIALRPASGRRGIFIAWRMRFSN